MKTYAGIGSRKTPDIVLRQMRDLGRLLGEMNYTLYSGGAEGADEEFERGCDSVFGEKKIFLPWDGFRNRYCNNSPKHQFYYPLERLSEEEGRDIAVKFHPNFSALSGPASKLMTRNSFQILGEDLESPVDFVVCWTPEAKGGGGTGQAIRIAKNFTIPIFDLCDENAARRLADFLKERVEV